MSQSIENCQNITLLGQTNWRNQNIYFGIKDEDRRHHIYCIGKTGMGKTTLLFNMARSDMEKGKGVCVLDPHGDLSETLLDYVPKERIKDVIYFNASDLNSPLAFNPLVNIDESSHEVVTSAILTVFKKLWFDSWGPRLEHILRFSILTLLHYPAASLLHIQNLLTDQRFRNQVLEFVSDISIIKFWRNEFEQYSAWLKNDAIAPILNKVGILSALQSIRKIVGPAYRSFDIREVMDSQKILICNLSKGKIGEDAAAFIGSMLLTFVQAAALSRASVDFKYRTPFYLYVDEVHSFATLSIVDTLAESRKYGLSIFLTHQYIEQLDERIRRAILGNIGTVITFKVGAADAVYLQNEFSEVFKMDDFINLPKHMIYIKLMIDGATSRPFSALTLPLTPFATSYKNEIIAFSKKLLDRNENGRTVPDEPVPTKTNQPSLFGS